MVWIRQYCGWGIGGLVLVRKEEGKRYLDGGKGGEGKDREF